ncbi:MAG: glycoside hydrolase family 3 C-terminal domain-containing protein [Lachnospiraceae bacterium]|nr:glycoside hydrolase family 3 C-terminal domain-containing protein [Lachnospiraceae bacterium]
MKEALKKAIPLVFQAAAEAAVLLKNDNNALPIGKDEKIALFGRISINYYRSGTGSGGNVNAEYETNVYDGFKKYGYENYDKEVKAVYEEWIKTHPFNKGNGEWASEPWHQEEMKLEEEFVKKSAEASDKALIFIGRTAGEDKDNLDEPGSYRLTYDEKVMVDMVCRNFEHVIVVLNTSNIIDLKWINEAIAHNHIDAVLYCSQCASEGGNALAALLLGKNTPSGHLTDTIAYNISDYPSDNNHGDYIANKFEEDIFVGYRYFETFAKDKVMYPFGYGLSYTQFEVSELSALKISEKERCFKVSANVKNVGNYSGAYVLQVYLNAPCGVVGRPSRELCGFAKTKELKKGDEEKLEVIIDLNKFAAYDDAGKTDNKSAYVLEKGNYVFFAGDDVRSAKKIENDIYVLSDTVVVKQCEEAMALEEHENRIKANYENGEYVLSYEDAPLRTVSLKERIARELPEEIVKVSDKVIKLSDVKEGRASVEEFVAGLTTKQLAVLVRGEGMSSSKATQGNASVFGGVSDDLMALGIPAVCCCDGPNGVNLAKIYYCTQIPVGTALAATFNPELIGKVYEVIAEEMVMKHVDCLLGPGINIHRHPLCGRNFEYYSEDPYLTGKITVAIVKALKSKGVCAVIKHMCANSQERARHTENSIVSERALREIYLKAFEMAVEEGADAIMTSYNKVNGHYTSSSYDLTTKIARHEWNFKGMIMTDWWSRLNDVEEGGTMSFIDLRSMVRSQNDVYMIVNNNAAATNAKGDNLEESLENGKLTKAELQRCAVNIINLVLKLPAMEREIKIPKAVDFATGQVLDAEASILDVRVGETFEKEINDENIVEKALYLEVKEEGIYQISVGAASYCWELAQVLSTLFVNGERAGDIQVNGTNGKTIELNIVKAKLHKGLYELKVEHVRPKIDLKYLRLTRVDF